MKPTLALSFLALALAATAAAQTAPPLPFQESHTGTYYPEGYGGQGLAVDVRRRPDDSHDVFVAFFGYGDDGDNHWLAGNVVVAPGAAVAEIPVFAQYDGEFASALDPATLRRAPFGTLTLSIDDVHACERATARFAPTDHDAANPFPRASDELVMVRLLPRLVGVPVIGCVY